MKIHNILVASILLLTALSCHPHRTSPYDVPLQLLEGEWEESPGIGYRETWQRTGNKMIGAGYMHSGASFSQVEELNMTIADSTIIYQAIVFNQNAGQQIDFYLKHFSDSTLVFENAKHDFPNSIAYQFINDSLLSIKVQSFTDSTVGFEFTLKKSRSSQ
jgi:hypothetical protein